MVKEVIWTELARDKYHQVILYLLHYWSLQDAENFVAIVQQKLLHLSEFPYIGIRSDKNPLIQQFLLTNHNKIHYMIENDKIIILDLIDTRQKPS